MNSPGTLAMLKFPASNVTCKVSASRSNAVTSERGILGFSRRRSRRWERNSVAQMASSGCLYISERKRSVLESRNKEESIIEPCCSHERGERSIDSVKLTIALSISSL